MASLVLLSQLYLIAVFVWFAAAAGLGPKGEDIKYTVTSLAAAGALLGGVVLYLRGRPLSLRLINLALAACFLFAAVIDFWRLFFGMPFVIAVLTGLAASAFASLAGGTPLRSR